jgi:hypothetical protein
MTSIREHHAIEDAQIEAVKVTLAAHQVQTTILADIEAIAVEQKDLMETVVASTTLQLKHNIRNEVGSSSFNNQFTEHFWIATLRLDFI